MNKKCEWLSTEPNVWETSCGQTFCLDNGLPSENQMMFCCSCGKPLEEIEELEIEGSN